ncbi:MAG: type IV toxin-antitoxin system AbiEi family antitoxin domain-containing protein [Akkermansiaceae bacterium]|nr:type IV toxin-antitoxin system AbiEi family antitoxin domain-containing protein [Akkermansiaceae bacterium]
MPQSLHQIFGNKPVSTALLRRELTDFQSPRAHLALLVRRGELTHLRRGLYLCRETGQSISEAQIANELVSPSYISYETALSWLGIIPEHVHTIKSACLGRSRSFENSTGRYTYTQLPFEYFQLGQSVGYTSDGVAYQIASAEKALCDLVLATPHLRLQSPKAARIYLEDFLRADEDELSSLNPDLIYTLALAAHKKKNDLFHLETTLHRDYL